VKGRLAALGITLAGLLLLGHGGIGLQPSLHVEAGKPRHETTKSIPVAANPAGVLVRNDVGDLSVSQGPAALTVVKRWTLRAPTVDVHWEATTLVVRGRCPDNVPLNDCSVDLHLTLPAPFALDASQGVGDVALRDVVGNFRVHAGVGAVTADNVRGDALTADSGVGDVRFSRLAVRRITANADTGDAVVDSVGVPDLVEANAGTGSVDVGVPAGAYAITTDVGWGDQQVRGLVSDPAAPRKIRATAGTGDVDVHAR
jgi:hypothetical protein